MKKFFSGKLDLFLVLLLLAFSPLFFYKLGQSSLVSWDEAWYAEIARNIVQSGDLLNLSWSGQPYFDHPPAGFWLIALAFKLFGVNEFWARFMPALSGLLSVVLVYFLGKELFGRVVGLASATALPSAFWFLFRARSGNLDTFLTMFFLLTLLLAWKSTQNKKFLIPFSLSFAFLILTKTLVPLVIIPALLVIFWKNHSFEDRDVFAAGALFFGLVGLWWYAQNQQPAFIDRYFAVGLPGVSTQTDLLANAKRARLLLHEGIGKWFWPGIGSLFASLIFLDRRFLFLTVFFLSFMTPFVFSEIGGIWHLVPLHPLLILSFFGFSYAVLQKIVKSPVLVAIPLLAVSIYFSSIQIRRSWYEFINIPAYRSDEEILSREASKYPQELLIAGWDFRPAATFYSGKNVPQRFYSPDLPKLFNSERSFLLIAPQSDLEKYNVPGDSYEVLKKDRDKVLVLKE